MCLQVCALGLGRAGAASLLSLHWTTAVTLSLGPCLRPQSLGPLLKGGGTAQSRGVDQFQQLASTSSGFTELLPAALRSQGRKALHRLSSLAFWARGLFLGKGSVARSTHRSFSLKILVLLIHRFGSLPINDFWSLFTNGG